MIVNLLLADLIWTFKEDKKNIFQEIGNRDCFPSYAIYNVLWLQNGLLREPSQSISSENIDWINSWIFHLLVLLHNIFWSLLRWKWNIDICIAFILLRMDWITSVWILIFQEIWSIWNPYLNPELRISKSVPMPCLSSKHFSEA